MSKNIVKLNDQYFSCSPIIENFEEVTNTPAINTKIKKTKNKKSKKKSKKHSRKGTKKISNKSNKKKKSNSNSKRKTRNKEGFCAGDTCLTEGDLQNIIDLLKKLELKK